VAGIVGFMALATVDNIMSESASGEADNSTQTAHKESWVCPTCEKSGFDLKKHMKIHHSLEHGESIAGEPVECDNCGDTFRKRSDWIEEYNHHLCSKECKSEWQSDRHSGEDHPNYKGGKTTYSCANCGKTFEKYPAQLKNTDRPFCSKSCNDEYWDGRPRPDLRKRVDVPCAHCGDMIEKRPSRVERVENVYCSRECADAGHSENMRGEGNPKWSGGTVNYYGPNWGEQREKARQRDDYTCQRCGIQKPENGSEITVHHKTPIREFDDYEQANRLENLISLCRSCHGKVELWPVQPK